MRIGWLKWRDRWYFMCEENGDMVSDEFRKVGGAWYRFGVDGTMFEKNLAGWRRLCDNITNK